MKSLIIKNARCVLPHQVQDQAHLVIKDGRIEEIHSGNRVPMGQKNTTVIDADGAYLCPGFIDIHSDAIEKEISPRPNTEFPIPMAFYELEKKLVGQGITTIYHSLSFANGMGLRSNEVAAQVIEEIKSLTAERRLIHNRIHLRYEITNLEAFELVQRLIEKNLVDLFSFMDHTPGQGQFKDRESYMNYVIKTYGYSQQTADDLVEQVLQDRCRVTDDHLKHLAKVALQHGIPLASHDDDTPEKVTWLKQLGVTISEFPVNLQAAHKAREEGMMICLGAPNVVRGSSHSNNMRAIDAIEQGVGDILCSDYHPSSILFATFKLAEKLGLSEAVKLTSLNPARSLGLEQEKGIIGVGMVADLIIIEETPRGPAVVTTIVDGVPVYSVDYRLSKRVVTSTTGAINQ
ncbi:MAG: phosphonate metabolism protein PhnM [Thermincolia bacterium]